MAHPAQRQAYCREVWGWVGPLVGSSEGLAALPSTGLERRMAATGSGVNRLHPYPVGVTHFPLSKKNQSVSFQKTTPPLPPHR